jgi:hypothetical protein
MSFCGYYLEFYQLDSSKIIRFAQMVNLFRSFYVLPNEESIHLFNEEFKGG